MNSTTMTTTIPYSVGNAIRSTSGASSQQSAAGNKNGVTMADPASAPRIHAETRQQWRQWLIAHHQTEESVWLVSWKKATGRPALSYDEAVSEALAVGWVDSKPQKLDDERTFLYVSPRKPGSAWSRPNKIRVEQLRREGLMTDAGERVIAKAIESGA